MIKQGEAKKPDGTVLTEEEYAALTSDRAGLAYEVVVKQYGPDWESVEFIGEAMQYLDAVVVNGRIAQVYFKGDWSVKIRAENDTNWTTVTLAQPTIPKGICSLASSGDTLYLFYYNGTAIRVMSGDMSAQSPALGSDTLIYTLAGVESIAAVSPDKVYLSYLNASNNHVLASIETGSPWTIRQSGIYWPFPFNSFDAVSLSDRDVIAFSGDLPPLWGTRAIGTQVSSYFSRVQGIIYFTVRNNRWSDYRTFDVIDRDVYGYSRSKMRLSVGNGYAFMSYDRHMIFRKYNDDGSLLRTSSPLRNAPVVSRSANGIDWEFPEQVMLPTAPLVVLPTATKLFAVHSTGLYSSNGCVWSGHSSPRSQTLTTRTLDIRSQSGDVRNSGIELANPYRPVQNSVPAQVLNGTLIDSKLRLQMELYLGYFGAVMAGDPPTPEKVSLPVLVSTEDVVKRVRSWQGPRSIMQLQSTDVLGRLARIRSDYAAEWPSQVVSRDPFTDATGTGYGGMKHMAPLEGQWKAANGILDLVSSMHRSLAESILISDTFNGSAQVSFKLTDANRKEYGGLAFRLLDKDNYFYVFYDIESDTIQLCRNMSGPDTVYATSGSMNWRTAEVWRWLRVQLRYSIVHVYTSADGVTWTELTWSSGSNELPGMTTLDRVGETMPVWTQWSGKIGLVGKGHSTVDAPPPIDPPVYPPPEPPPPPVAVGDAREIWRFTTTGIYWSGDVLNGGDPTWNKVAGAMPDGNPLFRGVAAEDGSAIYLAYPQSANAGIYKCTNPKSANPVWTDILAGQAYGQYPYMLVNGNYDMRMVGNDLVVFARANGWNVFYGYFKGVYNGTSWAWSQGGWSTGYMAYSWNNPKSAYIYGNGNPASFRQFSDNALIAAPNGYPSMTNTWWSYSPIWSFNANSHVTAIADVSSGSGGHVYLYLPQTNMMLNQLTDFNTYNYGVEALVWGSVQGNKVFVINTRSGPTHNGKVWIGDTSGVEYKTQWPFADWVGDGRKAGGGSLLMTVSEAGQSGEIMRINRDGMGTTWENMTGNMWSLTSGIQYHKGSSLVF